MFLWFDEISLLGEFFNSPKNSRGEQFHSFPYARITQLVDFGKFRNSPI